MEDFLVEQKRSNQKIPNLEIYTDGSLKRSGQNMTFGGWSFLALRGGEFIYKASGSEYGTTNQRMELIAIRNALEFAAANRQINENVTIYSDSAYAINCYNQRWYERWLTNGWVNSKNEAVANQDLWEQIVPYFDNFWYHFSKVKGHDENYWNNEADRLAQEESQSLKDGWQGEEYEPRG